MVLSQYLIRVCHQINQIGTRTLFTTPKLSFPEPPKKKKRLDPAILRLRVERKIVRAEREIARIERSPKHLIPILEYQYTNKQIRNLQSRERVCPAETLEKQAKDFIIANKLWSVYRHYQTSILDRSVRQMEKAQDKALKELEKISPELYRGALEVDEQYLVPFQNLSLKKETPPNPDYIKPDGDIKDISKEWVM